MIVNFSSSKQQSFISKLQNIFYIFGLFCLPATAFFIPLSVTATNVGIFSAAACSVLSGQFFVKFYNVKTNPLVISILMILVFAVFAMFWSTAPWSERLSSLHKYDKLLYFIFLIPLCIEEKWRDSAINSFLIAIVLTVGISFLKQYAGLTFGEFSEAGWVFHSHIETSYFVAFSAYIVIYRIMFRPKQHRCLYMILFLLFTWQEFFINDGRTGWLIYLALVVIFLGQITLNKCLEKGPPSRWHQAFAFLKGIIIGMLLATVLAFVFYIFSGTVRNIVNYAAADYFSADQPITPPNHSIEFEKNYTVLQRLESLLPFDLHHQVNNVGRQQSIDYRIDFFKLSLMMAKQHPMIGMGTGGFKPAFYQMGGLPDWGTKLDHPHNEYLLTLVQFGIVGLMLLLYFFYLQWKISFMWIKDWPIAQALVWSFMLGSCYNAFLYTTVTGHFYVFFMALLFSGGEQFMIKQDKK